MSSLGLSEYEKKRVDNIKRNNARLRELGLISKREEATSNSAASNNSVDYCKDKVKDEKKVTKKRKEPLIPSRQSKRLKGIEAENIEIDEKDHAQVPSPATAFLYIPMTEKERAEVLRETREGRLRAANEIAKAGADVATKNPTATYDHTMMRIRTMSERGLQNRVKMIEKSAGKHCVIKMAIFKSCLQDQNMWDLAKLAAEALERLKGLQPPP